MVTVKGYEGGDEVAGGGGQQQQGPDWRGSTQIPDHGQILSQRWSEA
jgi:hypothetical protein